MRATMGSERLIALTDGVVAVIITIMVLELKPPHGNDLASLAELGPTFLSFVLSFVYVAIYWNNHHHFVRLVPHVGGSVMWANLNLPFWLSLISFTTAWTDEHGSAPVPVALLWRLAADVRGELVRHAESHRPGTGTGLAPTADYRPRLQGQAVPDHLPDRHLTRVCDADPVVCPQRRPGGVVVGSRSQGRSRSATEAKGF